ncbi:cellulose synthase 2 [Thraustotheca clavata]|uniref:Cellulose synthase 2 n=1 Tax=Thraustotheca clavata TaxID=74557 RepID=A0A1V9ZBM9_9STRA|nr:cellulose synthase 2 [Thraustotheca clavata]
MDRHLLQGTPMRSDGAADTEFVRLDKQNRHHDSNADDPRYSYVPPMKVTERNAAAATPPSSSMSSDSNVISVHGYMYKQGKRALKGPIHKSWRKRYFALEKAKIYYFQNDGDCRRYFQTRNSELVVGAIELKDALQLRPSARLDLPTKGFEIHTKRRLWVLCPETDEEYRMWFSGVEQSIVQNGAGNVIERNLPNVRKYVMKGIATYRFMYFLFLIAGLVEIAGLVFWFVVGLQPCDQARPTVDCSTILSQTMDKLYCQSSPMNGVFQPPKWWLQLAGVENVVCFAKPSIAQWVSYFCLLLAELISFFLGAIYYLGMWKPVRRGAHYLDEFEPKLPDEQWPRVDIFICHYSEPADETIDTLAACMNLQYPPHLLQIYILDDGYCKTKFQKGNPIPDIELNKGVIESSGDLRQEVAQFMYDRVCDPNEELEVYAWRKLHSSANLPSASRPRVVPRMDCALGSFRDDYKYSGLPHVSFVGRVKPPTHYSKAGNINNACYNEGAIGRYCLILDNDMQPHPKFLLATLPFFFDSEERQGKIKYTCCTSGCNNIARMCCASCKIAGVPEDQMSFCSQQCFENSMHTASALHRRQVNGTMSEKHGKVDKTLNCVTCGSTVNKKGVCKKCNKLDASDLEDGLTANSTYSDEVRDNAVGFVQTPQYFRDCVQFQIGDPLGHRNATFYDAIQTGQDGYECASFAGTNAIFRREALDSIGGIQYGSLTEDCYTGMQLCNMGWKGLYFRKDFEGEMSERIRLAEGLVPDNVASSLAQRKRWAKGNFQIMLMNKKKNYFDKEWQRPVCQVPPKPTKHGWMRKVFFINSTIYPIGSICAVLFYYITLYFLFTGYAPIYMAGLRLLYALVPKLLIQGMLSAMSNRTVENNDVVRSQEAWFAYAFTHTSAVMETFWWKLTGKEPTWFVTGSSSRGSITELPNVIMFFAHVFGVIWALIRFFATYNSLQTSHGASLLVASMMMGIFIASKLGPSVRMSIQEYFGWSYHSLMDQGNFIGQSMIAFGLLFITLWVYIEKPSSNPF